MMKALIWLTKGLAWLWCAILVLGLFGELYVFIHQHGFWSGLGHWYDWFDPSNPINIAVRVVELLPAFGLFWVAGWLERRAEARTIAPSS